MYILYNAKKSIGHTQTLKNPFFVAFFSTPFFVDKKVYIIDSNQKNSASKQRYVYVVKMNSPLLIILLCTYDMFHPMFDIKFFNFINPILYLDLVLVLIVYEYLRVKDTTMRKKKSL